MVWTPEKKALADIHQRSGYLPALGAWAHSHSVPFWWHDSTMSAGSSVRNNGTAFFVSTGPCDLFVTCSHVYKGWLEAQAASEHLRCQVGGAVIEPTDRQIDRSSELDLATFSASEVLAATAGASMHRPASWPPRAAEAGEFLLVGGFPGKRRVEGLESTRFDFAWFLTFVEDVSPDRLVCCLEPDNFYSPQGATLEEGFDFGGTSGGPVLRVREGDVTTVEVVAFVQEYAGKNFDILVATPAHRVRVDGTIVPPGSA
jgi:hypothetical protein